MRQRERSSAAQQIATSEANPAEHLARQQCRRQGETTSASHCGTEKKRFCGFEKNGTPPQNAGVNQGTAKNPRHPAFGKIIRPSFSLDNTLNSDA
jgi:hypothetical protein